MSNYTAPPIDPALHLKAVEYLKAKLAPETKATVRGLVIEHGTHWIHKIPFGHFAFGMQIRNALRDVVKDAELPAPVFPEDTDFGPHGQPTSGNWDDYYISVIEDACVE